MSDLSENEREYVDYLVSLGYTRAAALEELEENAIGWADRTCPRHELNLIRPAKRWVCPRRGCPYSEAES